MRVLVSTVRMQPLTLRTLLQVGNHDAVVQIIGATLDSCVIVFERAMCDLGEFMVHIVCAYIYTHTCIYIFVYACMYVCMYLCTHKHTHTHTHTHTVPLQYIYRHFTTYCIHILRIHTCCIYTHTVTSQHI
jgi:hypothetical protein